MGICMSCDATDAGVYQLPTTKLILHDGELLEFTRPVKASLALNVEKCDPSPSGWFVCDADGMDFDGFVSTVDELRPGQIYFVLPREMLRNPLQPDDLAKLAVKASNALMRAVQTCPKGGSGSFRKRSSVAPQPLVFADEKPASPKPVSPPVRRASRKGRDFASGLTAIPKLLER